MRTTSTPTELARATRRCEMIQAQAGGPEEALAAIADDARG
ncbi:hypothetical protein Q427_07500 [Halomonas sp. BC04]|nr:hypothetical protein Q427_07500 [Halomonas sp. BC04]